MSAPPSIPSRGPEGGRDLAIAAALFLFGVLVAFRPIAGMDFHWHLAMGRAHLEHGPLLHEDPISHLPRIRPPDMGAWGGQALFALADRVGGLGAVRALVALVFGGVLAFVHLSSRRVLGSGACALLVASVVAAGLAERFRFRPDVFSVAGLWVLFDLLERAPSRRRDAAVLVLCAIWTQLHPGVVIAPVFAAAAWAGRRFRGGAGALLATLVGASLRPRGPLDLVDLTLETARTGPLVPEWRSIVHQPLADFAGSWALVALATLALAAAFLHARRGQRATLLAPALALAVAWRSVRLFYVLGLPVRAGLAALAPGIEARPLARRAVIGLALVLLVALPLRERLEAAASARAVGLSVFADEYLPNHPVAATRYLAGRPFEGRLFHPVRWGGYLGLHLAPRLRSAHDGRITLWGYELAEELGGFADASSAERAALVERLGIDVLVLRPGTLREAELVAPGMRAGGVRRFAVVHADATATVALDLLGPNAAINARAAAR